MLDFIKYNAVTYHLMVWWYGLKNRTVRSYVFVCSTGRCGTNTISDIFSNSLEITSPHEPHPTMYSDHSELPIAQQKRLSLIKRKHLNILKYSQRKLAYVKSNHMFIKTFFNISSVLLPSDKIKLIHVSRDPFSVASPFYAIDSIPGKPPNGEKFLLDPLSTGNLIDLSAELQSKAYAHDFYKCLWYWYETEKRVAEAKKNTESRIDWLELRTKDLNLPKKIKDLLSFVGVSDVMPGVDKLVGMRSNLKSVKKSLFSAEELKDREKRFDQLLVDKGITPYSYC